MLFQGKDERRKKTEMRKKGEEKKSNQMAVGKKNVTIRLGFEEEKEGQLENRCAKCTPHV